MEDSLSQQQAAWNYGFKQENGNGIPILKMHGSVNWLKVPDGAPLSDGGRYRVLFRGRAESASMDGPGKSNSAAWDLLCHVCCSPTKLSEDTRFRNELPDNWRALAGLGRCKPLDQLPGSWEVWAKAIKILKEVDEVYVIGFSLSPFDNMVRLHFAGAMCERAKNNSLPRKVVLIDPHACDLLARFREVFGPMSLLNLSKNLRNKWTGTPC